ncbi:MAG: energy-coupling factor transporter transmembrane protein EcfT [Chloroflexi bacterium]|nr:energy-coupling factor transporter transmembrane protein EcfT [Chloroflexota bacterium]
MLVAWKYRPRNTIIQRLDPRARLIFLACLFAAFSIAQIWDIRLLLPLFALSLGLYFLARIEWRDIKRVWMFILILVVFIVGINALIAGRGGPTEVLQEQSHALFQANLIIPGTTWGFTITITVVKAFFAVTQIVRMLTMAILAIPIPYTMDPAVYGVSFRRMGLPDKISFTMDLAFRFIPTLGRDFAITVDAQRARGYEVESLRGGLISRLRRLAPLIVPVTMQSIVTGEEVIDAMDLRAFGVRPRTWIRELHYQRRDYIFIGLGVAILLASIVLKLLGYGRFWMPEALINWTG